MTKDYWFRQTPEKPLFPDLEWARPENKRHAGKLLIIGGNLHGFAAPATAYSEAEQAGIGTTRVLLPSAIQKAVGGFLPEADFAPSTPSGSFATGSVAEWLDAAAWADGVLLAGDMGRNSETAIVVEKFLNKYSGQVTITKDVVDYFAQTPLVALNRADTTLVLSFAQLQKLTTNAKFPTALTFSMDLMRVVDALHDLTDQYPVNIVTKHLDVLVVASGGQVSTTKLSKDIPVWRVVAAAKATVWWIQHQNNPFESLTTSVVV